jgi:type I restriction enzyme S subunit
MKSSTESPAKNVTRAPMVRLEEICSLITDGTHQTPTYSEEGTIFLSAKNVVGGTIDWDKVKRLPLWLHEELYARLSPRRGDLLLAKNGTTGIAALVDRDEIFDIYVSLALLRPTDKILPEYLLRVVNSPDVTKQFTGALKGIGVPNLHLKDIRKAQIPLPSLAEQKRIAAILDAADALRTKRRESLAQLDALLQSTFLTLFGDLVTNPMGWERKKFSEIGTLDRGVSKHRPRNAPELLGGPYPLVQTGEVANCDTFIRNYKNTYSEIGLKQSKMWPTGTLCITIAANIAKTGILAFEACFPDSVVGFRADDPATVYFAKTWLSFLQKMLEETAPESAQKNINLEILRNLVVPYPPLPLQQKFAAIVESIERQKTTQRAHLAELDALFAALQHRAFRGEL